MKCRKNTESKNLKVVNTKKKEQCFHQNVWCLIVRNLDLLKDREASRLLLGNNSPFKGIPLIGSIIWRYEMNEIINQFLLAGHKFMPEMQWPRFMYSAFGPFTRNKERIKKFKETGDSRYIY